MASAGELPELGMLPGLPGKAVGEPDSLQPSRAFARERSSPSSPPARAVEVSVASDCTRAPRSTKSQPGMSLPRERSARCCLVVLAVEVGVGGAPEQQPHKSKEAKAVMAQCAKRADHRATKERVTLARSRASASRALARARAHKGCRFLAPPPSNLHSDLNAPKHIRAPPVCKWPAGTDRTPDQACCIWEGWGAALGAAQRPRPNGPKGAAARNEPTQSFCGQLAAAWLSPYGA